MAISIQLRWLTRPAPVCSGHERGGWWGEPRAGGRLNGRGGGRVPGDRATSDLWGLKGRKGKRKKDGGGGKVSSDKYTAWLLGRDRGQPPKGSGRLQAKGYGMGDLLMRRGQLGMGTLAHQLQGQGCRCALKPWNVSTGVRQGQCCAWSPPASTSLLVPISLRRSGTGQAATGAMS